MNLKKKILTWWWELRYKEYDIIWFDDLVDMETGERGVKVYHRVDSIRESVKGSDMLGIKTMTRLEAENMGGKPCEKCFVKILPTKEDKKVDWLYLFAFIVVCISTFIFLCTLSF